MSDMIAKTFSQKTAGERHLKALLIIISAPAGTGKTTLVNTLKKHHRFLRQTISCTSRAPRTGEKEGIDYFFVSKRRFEKIIAEGQFVEWSQIYGDYYGTPFSQIEQLQQQGDSVILVIDVEGALKLQRQFSCVTIFLLPPNLKELRQRLLRRGTDSSEKIEQRLSRAQYEMQHASSFDYRVINDDLPTALAELERIISFEMFHRNIIDIALAKID